MIVLDASITAPTPLPDEPPLPDRVAEQIAQGPLVAPQHWPLEVANLLLVAERRGRIARGPREAALIQVGAWMVEIDPDTADIAWSETVALAKQHDLTIYDAAYLELAIRRSAVLASLDRDLIAAAHARSVPVLTYSA